MTASSGAHLAMPPRSRVLTITAVAAVVLHGAAFWGLHWKTPPVAAPNAPQQQGIAIDLAPAPARASRPAATPPRSAQPPQHQETAPPPPQPKTETAPPQPRIRAQQQPVVPAQARDTSETSGGTAQTVAPATASSPRATATPSGPTGDPAPAPEAVNAKPAYPQLARKRGQEGRVLLRVQTNERGDLTAIGVATSSGYPLLDDAAVKGVRTWRFKPALRNGQPVPGTVMVPVEFRLQ